MRGVYKEEYFGFRNADDFNGNLPATPLSFLASEPVTDDTFVVSGNAAHVKAVAARGFFLKYLTSLIEGDVIEVECEVRNIAGVKVKIGIDEAPDTNPATARANVLLKQSTGAGEWESLKARYIVKNKTHSAAHSIAIGTFFGEVSEYYIRKVRVKVLKQIGSESIGHTRTVTSDSVITKWDDGVLEIESKKMLTEVSVTSAWGSIFTSPNLSLGSWPVSFVGVPTVSVIGISSNNSTLMTAIATAPTATTLPIVVLSRGTVTASPIPAVTFHIVAKGRWR